MAPRGKNTKKKRAKKAKKQRVLIPRTPNTVNNQMARMRYITGIELNPGAGGIDTHYFRANSIFDPDYTSVSGDHKAFGYDQWLELYNHYVVLGSRMKISVSSSAASTLAPAAVGIYLSDDTTIVAAGATELLEQGHSKWRVIPHTYGVKPTMITSNFSPKKFFNVTDVKDNLTRIGAAFGANPTEEAYFAVFCGPPDEATDVGTFYVTVTIDYLVAFSEPKEIGQS